MQKSEITVATDLFADHVRDDPSYPSVETVLKMLSITSFSVAIIQIKDLYFSDN